MSICVQARATNMNADEYASKRRDAMQDRCLQVSTKYSNAYYMGCGRANFVFCIFPANEDSRNHRAHTKLKD